MRGSPIRKSSDQRSVDSSPRLIAASYVLHRLLVPRHPPCALNNLATQKPRNMRPRKETMLRAYTNPAITESEDARVHCAVLNVQPATPHTPPPDPEPPQGTHGGTRTREALTTKQRSPVPSGPNSVPTTHPTPATRFHAPPGVTPYYGPARSRRPNWSAFHPRAPPHTLRQPLQTERPITVWARLWTTRTKRAASAP